MATSAVGGAAETCDDTNVNVASPVRAAKPNCGAPYSCVIHLSINHLSLAARWPLCFSADLRVVDIKFGDSAGACRPDVFSKPQ